MSGVRLRVLPSLPGCSALEGLQGTPVVWAGELVPTPAVDLEGYGPAPPVRRVGRGDFLFLKSAWNGLRDPVVCA